MEEPFENCISCGKYLLDTGTEYFIEKAFKSNSVEMEYAICINCLMNMHNVMSKPSMERTEAYILKYFKPEKRYKQLFSKEDAPYYEWIDRCLIKGTSVADLKEYIIYAQCNGKNMIKSMMPYMISNEALEEIQELLSSQTKEELDRFMDKHFGLPPEWKEIFKRDIVLF